MTSTYFRAWLLPVALVSMSACASHAPPAMAAGAAEQGPSTGRDRNVISREELSEPGVRAQSVLEAVRSLRPHFLIERGKNSSSDDEAGRVHASINSGRIVPLVELSNMHANEAIEIRYLDASAAMQKFGGAAREGPVILVRTR